MIDSIAVSPREDLNDLLLEMCRYGEPIVVKLRGGWFCRIDIRVASTGTEFKVESDFKHATPMRAVEDCHARIVAAVKQLEAIAK